MQQQFEVTGKESDKVFGGPCLKFRARKQETTQAMSDKSGRMLPHQRVEIMKGGEVPEVVSTVRVSAWVSPLPPPEDLRLYDQLIPNAGERMLKMAENEQSHRIYIERAAIKMGGWGLAMGITVAILLGFGGFWLIHNGRNWAGWSVIAGVAGVFVLGTRPYIRIGTNG